MPSPADITAAVSQNPALKAEMNAEGFPDYMIYTFMQSAAETNSIILSRVPGGAGKDLIDEGCDLKGFHIKAKSCSWGPMSGFICQIPVFNKAGFSKMSYNIKEIGYYLNSLNHFSLDKAKIDDINTKRNTEIAAVKATFTPQTTEKQKVKAISDVNKKYDPQILAILKAAQDKEKTSGHWSGENTLEDPSPFIPLSRKLGSDDANVLAWVQTKATYAVSIRAGIIYCRAANAAAPSVQAEFLLVKKSAPQTDVWDIYHGDIFYKTGDGQAFKAYSVENATADKDDTAASITGDTLTAILTPSATTYTLVFGGGEAARITAVAPFAAGTGTQKIFKAVNGIMNPFPPFPKSKDGALNPEYYKNAVSGDYDLFSIWPKRTINEDEMIRESEFAIAKKNNARLGGKKIFTSYFGYRCDMGVEFIPGFKELNPSGGGDVLKESADFGNMHSLCHLVSGIINSYAARFIETLNNNKTAKGNKGFHSDEGGRPGIMEVEFPIAVFFPKKLPTWALDNLYLAGDKLPAIEGRKGLTIQYGLIKSIEELAALMRECIIHDFRVYMHNCWMMHMLYVTALEADRTALLDRAVTKYLAEIKKLKPTFDEKKKTENYKEFTAITDNKKLVDAKFPPESLAKQRDNYIRDLRILLMALGEDIDNPEFFIYQVRDLWLGHAFQPTKPSLQKRQETETLMINIRQLK